jgi:hypothetical protein
LVHIHSDLFLSSVKTNIELKVLKHKIGRQIALIGKQQNLIGISGMIYNE